MIILFKKFDKSTSLAFFDIFRIKKCHEVILLQRATGCYYEVHQVLQSLIDHGTIIRTGITCKKIPL